MSDNEWFLEWSDLEEDDDVEMDIDSESDTIRFFATGGISTMCKTECSNKGKLTKAAR